MDCFFLFSQSGYLRHEGLEESGGDGLGPDVASDPLHLLLLLPPGHLVPGHGGPVDDGGGGERELGARVRPLVRFKRIASILIRVPEKQHTLSDETSIFPFFVFSDLSILYILSYFPFQNDCSPSTFILLRLSPLLYFLLANFTFFYFGLILSPFSMCLK